jgi:predicted RNA-binding Zn ribbon-like protein
MTAVPRTPTEPTDFRFDTGARWLDLVATRAHWPSRAPVERIPDVERLTAWWEHYGLSPRRPATDADLAATRQVRAALRELAVARVQRRAPHPQSLDVVNTLIANAPRSSRHIVVPDAFEPGRLRRQLPDNEAALGLITAEAVDLLAGPDAMHLNYCEDETCRLVYFDPAGRRRWCSTQGCGTRARVRAHRARQRSDAGQVP